MNDAGALRVQLVKTAQRMAALRLVRGSSGNVSSQFGERILITASGIPYEKLTTAQIIEIDRKGKKYAGEGAPSSEWRMHVAIYEKRNDVQAIVHTHSPYATAAAIALSSLPIVHDEGEILFGKEIPVSKHAPPGTWGLAEAVVDALGKGKAVLIACHGVVTVGATPEETLRLAEKVEEMAQLFWLSQQLKRTRLPPEGEESETD